MRPLFLNAYRHNYRHVLVGLKCQRPIVFLHLHERARPRLGGFAPTPRRLKNIRIATQIDARLLVDANQAPSCSATAPGTMVGSTLAGRSTCRRGSSSTLCPPS